MEENMQNQVETGGRSQCMRMITNMLVLDSL